MATPLTYPPLIPIPFANTGTKNTIPEASASPLASLEDGFPPVTMQPISTGGVPPAGKDFNGIFYWITQFQAWVNGGGRFKFDATFATTIGGYPVGVILQLDDDVSEVVCVTANNTNDPNSNMTGWAPYAGAAAGAGQYVADTGSVNNIVATVAPGITSYKNGYWVVFKALNTNTGAVTINTGGGAVSLKRNDGAALQAGDIASGSIYRAVYDTATTAFRIECMVPSQVSQSGTASAIQITSSSASGTPTVDGASPLLTLGGGATNKNIVFTAVRACKLLVSAQLYARGVDDANPGGGQNGYLLVAKKNASTVESCLVWLATNGAATTNDYNVTETIINSSGSAVDGNTNFPAFIITLAAGDTLTINLNDALSASAWSPISWKYQANIALLGSVN